MARLVLNGDPRVQTAADHVAPELRDWFPQRNPVHHDLLAAALREPALAGQLAALRARGGIVKRRVLTAGLALLCSVAAAQRLAPQMSPIVTFDPYGANNNPPSARPLTAAETRLARELAAALFDATKATPVFREPGERVSLLASWAIVGPQRAVEQSFAPYWSAANDARRRADGALVPGLGGPHRVFSFTTNQVPAASKLEDRATRGNFSRSAGSHGLTFDAIAMPRVLGELGGGTVYADMVVFTRDGRSVLEPAPLGPLLAPEVQRLRQFVADLDAGFAGSLRQLEASMTPRAIAACHAKREDRWKTETRDPAAVATRLDAAERTAEVDCARQKERMGAPATRDPKSVWWGPRLALEAVQSRLASFDAAGQRAAACGRVDTAFLAHHAVRFEPLPGAPADCVPMVQVRRDLVDPKQPASEVRLFTLWFGEILCGLPLTRGQPPQVGTCEQAVPLMRELDWAAMRKALGW